MRGTMRSRSASSTRSTRGIEGRRAAIADSPDLSTLSTLFTGRMAQIPLGATREAESVCQFAMRNGPPAREESSETRPPRKRAAIFGSQATEAMEGSSKEKREAQADPTFFEGPPEPEASAKGTENEQVPGSPENYSLGTDRGRKTSAGTPNPQGACSDGVQPARERRQALTGAAVRTRDKWGPVATPAPILVLGTCPRSG